MSLERHVKTQIVYIEYFNFCNQQLQEYIFTLRLFDNFKSIPPVSNFFCDFFVSFIEYIEGRMRKGMIMILF